MRMNYEASDFFTILNHYLTIHHYFSFKFSISDFLSVNNLYYRYYRQFGAPERFLNTSDYH